MNEEDGDRAFELYEKLSADIHDLLNKTLADEKNEVAGEVRARLADEFRFWERI